MRWISWCCRCSGAENREAVDAFLREGEWMEKGLREKYVRGGFVSICDEVMDPDDNGDGWRLN